MLKSMTALAFWSCHATLLPMILLYYDFFLLFPIYLNRPSTTVFKKMKVTMFSVILVYDSPSYPGDLLLRTIP